ncbi:glycoside hydrolase family 3 protein [Microcella pacifica]|uniref:Glycoside hydrolase family 3 protein n=1 Tax=Microcella pacifica TaxID=2591847 RepID=A0A9E5JQH5_9MICO|nr:glycoside hydrolase family 3 N-terminal domain-containing protein [Microcella pacifica]NHF63116.1 glycoside hydrolase family 3 protein [Microcella pacifica]
MTGDSKTGARGTLLPGFIGTELPEWLADRLRAGLAGVCVFGPNIRSRDQLRSLVAQIRDANPRAIVAIDEEGGDVTRLYYDVGSPYPGNAVLGRLDDLAFTEYVARVVGWELRLADIDLDLAPDADVNSNPLNPVIGTRSFGADPAHVARHTAAWVRGLQSTGIAASVKHFPGHGDTALDSHLSLPVVAGTLEQLRQRELVPFRAAIEAGARTIMSSHILLPDVDADDPATFSSRILTDLLRGELGFEGVIVSDALDMVGASGEIGIPRAAVRALAAGCDLLCIGTGTTADDLDDIEAAIALALASGELAADRVADAAARVRALAEESASLAAQNPVPEWVTPDDEPSFDAELLQGVIDADPAVRVRARRQLVSVHTTANIAVGVAPWGPVAAGADAKVVLEGHALDVPHGVQPVIVGQGHHRHAWVRSLIDTTRAEHPETIVVEMGWPDADRRYADVVTWGASRAMGAALLDWLEGRAGTGEES